MNQVTPENVGPGVLGFIVTALVVIAAILLMVNMSRKVRRVRYREQVREEFEGRATESDGAAGTENSEGPAGPEATGRR